MSFQKIIKRQELAERQKTTKDVKLALALAIGINILNLVLFANAMLGAILAYQFKGIPNILILIIVLFLSANGLKNSRTRAMAIVAIVLSIVSLSIIFYYARYILGDNPLTFTF